MQDFKGLAALVTGGAGGIGSATAVLLAERGARVAVADLTAETVDPPHVSIKCDVTSRPSVEAAVDAAVDAFGRLDVVVSNAGIGSVGDVTANDDEQWHHVLNVNVIGTARVVAAALPHLRRSQHAAVVVTSSVVATLGVPERAAYAASKGAVHALALAMAADHMRDGIRVTCVAPGTTDTPWVGRLLACAENPAAAAASLRARQPLGRLVRADEVAHAIAYLASPTSGATTGTVLTVDGGMSGLRLPT